MIRLLALSALLVASPANATRMTQSQPLDGFKPEMVTTFIFKNPADAIGADPRFEPEQIDPSIRIKWTRDSEGFLWADVNYTNPDTGIYREKNERFKFSREDEGGWTMIGHWARWKCIGSNRPDWTLKACVDD